MEENINKIKFMEDIGKGIKIITFLEQEYKEGLSEINLVFNPEFPIRKEQNLYSYERLKKDTKKANQNGYESGYEIGFVDGEQIGYESGYEIGYEEGYETGEGIGFENGYKKALEDMAKQQQKNKKNGTVTGKGGRRRALTSAQEGKLKQDKERGMSYAELAVKYKIGKGTAYDIVNGRKESKTGAIRLR